MSDGRAISSARKFRLTTKSIAHFVKGQEPTYSMLGLGQNFNEKMHFS